MYLKALTVLFSLLPLSLAGVGQPDVEGLGRHPAQTEPRTSYGLSFRQVGYAIGERSVQLNHRQFCGEGRFRCEKFPGCCSVETTCFESVEGEHGCCPIGRSCTTIGTCQAGSFECLESEGGGCCRNGYVCFSDACVLGIESDITSQPMQTPTHNIPTLTIVPDEGPISVPTFPPISEEETSSSAVSTTITTTSTENPPFPPASSTGTITQTGTGSMSPTTPTNGTELSTTTSAIDTATTDPAQTGVPDEGTGGGTRAGAGWVYLVGVVCGVIHLLG